MKKAEPVIVFPLGLIILGIFLIVWFFVSDGPYAEFTGRTTGTVLSCSQSHHGTDDGDMDEYESIIRYTVDGTEHESRFLSPGQMTAGEEIELAYDPEDHRRAVFASETGRKPIVTIGGLLLILVGLLLMRQLRKNRRQESAE